MPGHDAAVESVIAYHDRTKHHEDRFARGPAGLDWANQPNPFRRFEGSPVFRLPLASADDTPSAAVLFGAAACSPAWPLSVAGVGLFFELSLALSACKAAGRSRWFLRNNPSSGNLHPTEAYAVFPELGGVLGGAGVYHYAPFEHALEQRASWSPGLVPAEKGFGVGLTSVMWREAWKYGERAFRYCQHDVGHALGALRFAAAALGWQLRYLRGLDDERLGSLLGLDRDEDFRGAEREVPELLAWVAVEGRAAPAGLPAPIEVVEWKGHANRLSPEHVHWPVIEEVTAASRRGAACPVRQSEPSEVRRSGPTPPPCGMSAGQLIRRRRSAVAYDGVTAISRETFLAMLDTTMPREGVPPFDAWPLSPRLHLVLFVHRVTGVEPGLYLAVRDPQALDDLRRDLHGGFTWELIADVNEGVPLYRLAAGDVAPFAREVSCGQDIAADSAFSLGMLARFGPVLRTQGAFAYREMFWEAGLIGQVLYLAAEAAGLRGTGIGCYLDDVLHRALGLKEHGWQSLYHFTIGYPTEDERLRTVAPYAHLNSEPEPADRESIGGGLAQ